MSSDFYNDIGMGNNTYLFSKAINKNRDKWDNLISELYDTISDIIENSFNTTKNHTIINICGDKISIDKIKNDEILFLCVGGSAYHSWAKLFEHIDSTLDIDNNKFPKTTDWDISMSLKHTVDTLQFMFDMNILLFEFYSTYEWNDMLDNFLDINNELISSFKKNHNHEKIINIGTKFFITNIDDDEKIVFRLNMFVKDEKNNSYLGHIIELLCWKYNQISSLFSLSEVMNKMVILNIDGIKHKVLSLEKLIVSNKYAMDQRFNNLGKLTQDYFRIKYVINSLEKMNMNNDDIKIYLNECKRDSNYKKSIKMLESIPYKICNDLTINKSNRRILLDSVEKILEYVDVKIFFDFGKKILENKNDNKLLDIIKKVFP